MQKIFDLLIHDLKLGQLVAMPTQLSGGALHTMWHAITSQGEYAIKQINRHIASKSSFPQSYECAENIAETFFKNGISAVSAIKIHNHFVHEIQNQWFIVYPMIKSKIISLNEINVFHAGKIGKIFFRMHDLKLSIKGVDNAHYEEFSNDYWEELISQTKYGELIQLIHKIKKWNIAYQQAIPVLNQDLRITHRDLHHLNVLWHNDEPWIIDWESAGLMNPTMEIVGYGLEWAGILFNHQINEAILKAILGAYHDFHVSQSSTPIENAFYGWLGHCALGWTEFNLRRLLGLVSKDEAEIKRGEEIIKTKMIPCLSYLSEYENSLISLLTNLLITE